MGHGIERLLKDLEKSTAHTQKVLIKMFRLSKYTPRDTVPLTETLETTQGGERPHALKIIETLVEAELTAGSHMPPMQKIPTAWLCNK
jgi:hypothetical protein